MHSQGMTKIEVLIVVLVLGLLGAASAIAVSLARSQVRDTTRLAHVREVGDALEAYFGDHSAYPEEDTALALGTAATLCLDDAGFRCTLAGDTAYLRLVPTPPAAGLRGQSSCGGLRDAYCYASNGESYRLQFELERANQLLGLAKGANCATESALTPGLCAPLD